LKAISAGALIAVIVSCGGGTPPPNENAASQAIGPDGSSRSALQLAAPAEQAHRDLARALTGGKELAPAALADRADDLLDGLSKASHSIARDTFDPQVIVDRLGKDADRLFAWVRDETALVPYAGTLRGPVGVLLDRSGNSLDRSLLLAELLRLAGFESRLARTTLTPAQSQPLLKSVGVLRNKNSNLAGPASTSFDQFVDSYATKFALDASVIKTRARELREAGVAAGKEAAKRATSQTSTLLTVLGRRLDAAATETADWQSRLTDHWWVQTRRGEAWIDLDVASVFGVGQPAPSSATTLAVGQIGDELRHLVTVRVSVECLCGGKFIERPVLEHTARVSDLAGVSMVFRQLPTGAATDWTSTADEMEPRFSRWLAGQKEWMPVLAVGPKVIANSRFTTAAVVTDVASGGSKASPAGGMFDAFSGEEPADSGAGRLTAEYIDYEFRVPGSNTRVVRRALFDRIGAGARARAESRKEEADPLGLAAVLLTQTDIVVLGAQPSPAFVDYLTARSVLAGRSAAIAALRSSTPGAQPPQVHDELDSGYFNPDLFQLALARRAWSEFGKQQFLAEANVLTLHEGLLTNQAGMFANWRGFDVINNRVEILATDTRGRSAAEIRLYQGVLDTNAEAIIMRADRPASNLAEDMLGPNLGPSAWKVVNQSADARVMAELGRGQIVVAPGATQKPGEFGWWQIDPSSGTTLGMTNQGWGGAQNFIERWLNENEAGIKSMRIIFRYIIGISCMASVTYKELRASAKDHTTHTGRLTGQLLVCAVANGLSAKGTLIGKGVGAALSLGGDIISLVFGIYSLLSAILTS
jgi:hypothetical protein